LAELMQLVGLTHRATFQKNDLNPAIKAGLIEREIPNKPKNRSKSIGSSNQFSSKN